MMKLWPRKIFAGDAVGEAADGSPDIVHGGHFVLVDQRGRIRGFYASDEAERLDALARDAARLASGGQ